MPLLRLRVLGVDDFALFHGVRTWRTLWALGALRSLVELLRHRMRRALQILGRLLDRRDVLAPLKTLGRFLVPRDVPPLCDLAPLGDRGLDPRQVADRHFLAVVVDRL